MHAYASKQTEAFKRCEAKEGTRRCSFMFEYLNKDNDAIFFHADQIIRSLYHPFLEDWHAAFGSNLLALPAEALLDTASGARDRAIAFLNVAPLPAASAPPSATYMELHAKTLAEKNGTAFAPKTRKLLEDFFAPYNKLLADMLGDDRLQWRS